MPAYMAASTIWITSENNIFLKKKANTFYIEEMDFHDLSSFYIKKNITIWVGQMQK